MAKRPSHDKLMEAISLLSDARDAETAAGNFGVSMVLNDQVLQLFMVILDKEFDTIANAQCAVRYPDINWGFARYQLGIRWRMKVICVCGSWHDFSPTQLALIVDAFISGDLQQVSGGRITNRCFEFAFTPERLETFRKRYPGNTV